ncbi:MAG: single-stranded-DNA-specific exonuclease RecJ [Bacteroidetes bacterium]|nr:single-stranded-DNA-specific exonuclease RecJ [Bacteroidota bacterium]
MNANKNWVEFSQFPNQKIEEFANLLHVKNIYAKLLLNRGINSLEETTSFFSPDLSSLHDPFRMKDMLKAVLRIDKAYTSNQKVWVYGDYDVDGTTSVALMFGFLRQFIPDINYYVPDREKEGYGISNLAIDIAIQQKVDLIISLDCGIRSVDLVQKARDHQIDFIICDHHEPGEILPPAIAILDPKVAEDPYPYKELSGCGIGFKLVQALCIKWNLPETEAYSYLDLVAVSIASDLVPINGENRTLALHGLKKLNTDPSPGLKRIIDVFIDQPELDVVNIVFMIGPRINAAGRMASARAAIQLLLAEEDLQIAELASQLNDYNNTRKNLDKEITKEALRQIRSNPENIEKKTNVAFSDNWHKGVIGIVASRVLEQHYKPTIIFTRSGDYYVGSARSIESFDVHEALVQCSEFLYQFGGHKYAAGLKILPENLQAFRDAFENSAGKLTKNDLTETLRYEAEITLAEINLRLLGGLKKFAPFGPGNPEPLFLLRNATDTGFAKIIGGDQSHLKVNLIDPTCSKSIGAVGFGLANKYDLVSGRKAVDVLFTINENHFMNQVSLQLMIKDIRPSQVSV